MARTSAERPWLRSVPSADSQRTPQAAVPPNDRAPSDGELNGQTLSDRTLSDAALIDGILDGDARIAGKLHDRLIRVIDHTLYRIFGRREHDHDDLIQTCFEQIIRTLIDKSFAGNCSLKTWAGRVSTYVALNALRSRQRERRVIQHTEPPSEGSPDMACKGNAEAHVELARVRRALGSMKRANAEVLVLHDIQGFLLSEIASTMGISASAAQSRLVRGRRELQELLNRLPSSSSRRSQ